MRTRFRNQRGTALLETAVVLPIILFVSVAIFEFGRAYQVQQVVTNAAREGARLAVIEGPTDADVTSRVTRYLADGLLDICGQPNATSNCMTPTVIVDRAAAFGTSSASSVTVNLPFSFMVLNPVARLVVPSSTAGQAPVTLHAVSLMRNE